jgi:hypothetical protein
MTISSPPSWTDPGSGSVDLNSGPWTAAAVDAICSDLKVLGGADGGGGLATPYNLLVNPGLEIWQRGIGPFTASSAWLADRWQLSVGAPSTASVTRSQATIDAGSSASLAFTYTYSAGGSGLIQQKIEDFGQLAGRTVTFTARVYTTVPGVVAQIVDSGGLLGSTPNAIANGWETISVTKPINSGVTSFVVQIVMPAASTTCYLDNAVLYVGAAPAIYRPLHPADDFARCLRYYEIIGSGGSNLIVEGIATAAGQTARLVLPYKVQKAINPTVTRSGSWALVNCSGQPVPSSGDVTGCYLTITSSAAGQFNAVNSNASCWIVVDAPE